MDAHSFAEQKSANSSAGEIDKVLQDCLEDLGLELSSSKRLQWRRSNPEHPRNWPIARKALDCGLVLWFDCFTTAISTAGPSAASYTVDEYGLSNVSSLVAFTLMYQLGQATGGVVFPPYSETFGRKPVYIVSAAIYCVFCIVIAFVPSVGAVYVGRFITGVMSAVPSVIVGGSIEDMFNFRIRVWIIWIWACATTTGLILGPIYGSYIARSLGWRWIFHIAAIVTGFTTFALLFMLESRPSRILHKKSEQLKLRTGYTDFFVQNPDHAPNFQTFCKLAVTRPIRLFFTEPIVLMVTVMSAIGWGLIYMFTESLPVVYQSWGFTPTQASLAFIPIGLGVTLSILPRFHDSKALARLHNAGTPFNPEDKLFGFFFAAPALAVGLWWVAWTTPPKATNLHWAVSMIGLFPIGFATNEFVCTLSGYLADSYTVYASSAFAALAFLRAIIAGCLPLFGRNMYESLGSNIAGSIVASVAVVFCVCPVILKLYGKRIRQRSKFARYSLQVHRDTQVELEDVE